MSFSTHTISFTQIRALDGYWGSWSQTGCPPAPNLQNLNVLLLKICIKIISLPEKTVSEWFGIKEELWSGQLFFWRIFGKLTILTQTLRSRKFEFSKLLGASSLRSAASIPDRPVLALGDLYNVKDQIDCLFIWLKCWLNSALLPILH